MQHNFRSSSPFQKKKPQERHGSWINSGFIDCYTYKITTSDYFRRPQTQYHNGHEENLFFPSSMNGYSKSPNCDPRWRRLRHRLRENDIEATIVHVCFYILILEETLISSQGSVVKFRLTFKPCGSESDLENLPCRRSRSVYPSSLRSVDCFVSPDTVRMLLLTSIDTSSFCRPGSSKVAQTVFDLSS